MIKMYAAEVLGKFPVVQHFPFGALFSFERDPDAPQASTAPQPTRVAQETEHAPASNAPAAVGTTRAPWAAAPGSAMPGTTLPPPTSSAQEATRAPWAAKTLGLADPSPPSGPGPAMPPTRAPWASASPSPSVPGQTPKTRAGLPMPSTRAPWATSTPTTTPPVTAAPAPGPALPSAQTRAPWAPPAAAGEKDSNDHSVERVDGAAGAGSQSAHHGTGGSGAG